MAGRTRFIIIAIGWVTTLSAAFLYLLAIGSLWFLRSGDSMADGFAGLPDADPEYPDLRG